MSEENNGTRSGAMSFLKNAESILVMIVLALILWVGATTWQTSIRVVELTVKMDALTNGLGKDGDEQKERINRVKEIHRDDVLRIDNHMSTIWPRLREMKERVQHLENKAGSSPGPWKY